MVSFIAGAVTLSFRSGTFAGSIKNMQSEIRDMKRDQVDIKELLVKVAVQDTRLNNLDTQVGLTMKQIEDLRHGEGFIVRRKMDVS